MHCIEDVRLVQPLKSNASLLLSILIRNARQTLLGLFAPAWTLVLFTYTDFKTIFFPITVIASVCAPVSSWSHLFQGMLWIWLHLLQCNVSNQYKSVSEDLANKPWRPIPAGRISQSQATILRWAVCLICLAVSAIYGLDVVLTSAALALTTIIYDEVGLSGHWLGKNASAVFGYLTFEVGATKIMGHTSELDAIAMRAIYLSTSIILTTIHAQDFQDVDGDKELGRVTFPIYLPEVSRIFTFVALIMWSVYLGWTWDVDYAVHALVSGLGGYVSWRYYRFRATKDDKKSYRLYNLWLILVHLLPLGARLGTVVPF